MTYRYALDREIKTFPMSMIWSGQSYSIILFMMLH